VNELIEMQRDLMSKIPHGHRIKDEHQALVVAGIGLMEEVLEYLNAIGFKSWRPNPLPKEDQLEELTDQLFFFLEEVILSGFTWEDVVAQYHKKHTENLARYEKAKQGNFDWDLRGKKEGL